MTTFARPVLTSPDEFFGFRLGDSGRLASWASIRAYCDRLVDASDRVTSIELGLDWSGVSIPAYFVSTAETIARLEDYQAQQTLPENANREKAVVLITASIHATEVGGTQMTPRLLFELATGEDETTLAILSKIIIILVPSMNPGGLEHVRDWYEHTRETAYEGSLPPCPDHPVGHDINRDWVMFSQPESNALHTFILRRWRPLVHLDLHEMQTNGPRYCLPPYIEPIDQYVSRSVVRQSGILGRRVAESLLKLGRRGVVTGMFFDAFSPVRSYVNYHGGLRMLAEAANARLASPVDVPRMIGNSKKEQSVVISLSERRQAWTGGRWTLHDIVDLHHDATLSLLDQVAQSLPELLHDLSTTDPSTATSGSGWLVLPYALQRDPDAAYAFIDVLVRGEIRVERLESTFSLNGVTIPPGAFHIPPAQPFIGYANTLLEPSVYPGYELTTSSRIHVPYDVTGHTLPLMMGVDTIRLPLPLEIGGLNLSDAPPAIGWVRGSATSDAYAIPCTSSASARVINGAFELGAACRRITAEGQGDDTFDPGTFLINGISRNQIEDLLRDTGLVARGFNSLELESGKPLNRPQVGIYTSWMHDFEDAGWTTHVLSEFGFAPQPLRDAEIKTNSFDGLTAIILPSQQGRDILYGHSGTEYPEEFRGGIGHHGVEALRAFVRDGGTLIALGSACDAAMTIVPSSAFNHVAALSTNEFQTPGAIVRLELDSLHPLNWGLESPIAAMVTNCPVFDFGPGGVSTISEVARYSGENPLLAGWIHGQNHLLGRAAIIEIRLGNGRAYMMGCRPQFRGMAHGTFRLLFNAIYASSLAND